jgi:SAM-dependent methyltransferase
MVENAKPQPDAWDEYWEGPAAERWVTYEARLDRAFEPFARELLRAAELRSGEQVLDVGCGCGTTTLAAAREVAPGGSATGLDLSIAMLARARARAEADGIPNARFVRGDAGTFALDRRFDAWISRFGVMFFLDPAAAFGHLREALLPGGRVAFVCWRRLDENPWATVPLDAALQATQRPRPEPPAPGAPGPFAFGDRACLERVLSEAGLAAIDVRALDADVLLSTTGLEDAVAFSAHAGPAGRLVAEVPQEARPGVDRAIAEALSRHLHEGQVRLGAATWIVTARAP